MFIYKISIIILICQKLGTLGPIQQKIKLPSPNVYTESQPIALILVVFLIIGFESRKC